VNRHLQLIKPLGIAMAGVLNHALVPMHEVLTDQEAIQELQPFGLVIDGKIETSALPLIGIDDPALLGACVPRPKGVSARWPIDSVVRITRRSAYTGISYHYRCVSAVPVYPTMRMSANALHEIVLEEDDDWTGDADIDEEQQPEEKSLDQLQTELDDLTRMEDLE
jgi:DNA-directed RNA polymerase subunit H (RpoH/RPB5)